MEEIFKKAKEASRKVALMSDEERSCVLLAVADAIEKGCDTLLEANAKDLSALDASDPLYDRLKLTKERIAAIAADMRKVASLPCPCGRTLEERVLPNGLKIKRVSVPFGVIGMIYEARPNVTFDVFSICLKSGNATILKGSRNADCSNRAAVGLIKEVLSAKGAPADCISLLEPSHEATGRLLNAVGYVDLVIPRGGRKLIDFVRDNAKVPCIETGAGIVNTYFDRDGDIEKGRAIVTNAKTRRVSVCNALDCLIIHADRLADLPQLTCAMKNVTIYADERAYAALEGSHPAEKLQRADESSFGTEWLDYKLSIRTVDSLDEALGHIARYGSGHSEAIVTESSEAAERFQAEVDAACVYVNAPTSFTDGAQFGLGAEIGISTQKLGSRGPMGLEAMNSYKWLITGSGQVRP